MELEKLVIRFKQKDSTAFEKLYDMYGDSMQGVIYNIVKNTEVAEEVLQDVFLKAWNNSDSYTVGKGRFFTWILNIARNAAIDKLRSKNFKDQNKNLDSSIFVDILETNDYTDAVLDVQYLRKVVNSLDKKCITLIDLIYFKGFTQKEASEELGIPLGTVKTNNRKCVSELRTIMKD